MIDLDKKFSRSAQQTYRHGSEVAARCDDCAAFSGWFSVSVDTARWERGHRCGAMIRRCAAARDAAVVASAAAVENEISQAEYLVLELGYLLRKLTEGNDAQAATSVATLHNELDKVSRRLKVDEDSTCGRITTTNGRYYRWSFLNV